MKLYTIETGNFKLDGGAMFGVVPKAIWHKHYPADANNMVNCAMRCLLIEDGDKLILIDTGIGNKQSEQFFSRYYLNGEIPLDNLLQKIGFSKDDITDVLLTHLHFDHCGGAIIQNHTKNILEPAFKNARYWSHKNHWKWATNPNEREKYSFLSDNILPIEQSGQLHFINDELPFNFSIKTVDGHTEKQIIPIIEYKGKTIVFVADLIPTVAHIPIPYIPSFDTRPLLSMDEKTDFLKDAADNNYFLFFEHDAQNEICTVKHTEKGVKLNQIFKLSDL